MHLLPTGDISGVDGRSYVLRDPQTLIDDFAAGGLDLPVDYHHQNDGGADAGRGPIPAAGWIKELTLSANGIWGRVARTARAMELIGAKEYRYLSPSFHHLKDRSIVRLKGAGLVHSPNLKLVALAAEQVPPREGVMARLAELLDLAPDASEDDVFAAIVAAIKAAGMGKAPATADDPAPVPAVNAQAPDPARYVPIDAVRDLLKDHNRQLATNAETRAAGKVEDAFQRGYLTTAMRPWALSLCRQDEASFDAFLGSTVPMFAHLTRPSTMAGVTPPGAELARHDEGPAAAVCAQLGLPVGALKD